MEVMGNSDDEEDAMLAQEVPEEEGVQKTALVNFNKHTGTRNY